MLFALKDVLFKRQTALGEIPNYSKIQLNTESNIQLSPIQWNIESTTY